MMKSIRLSRVLLAAACTALLGSCGGDGGNAPTAATEVSTTTSGATIEKAFKPGFVMVPDDGAAFSAQPDAIEFSPVPAGVAPGTVFGWRDRAYVVVSLGPAVDSKVVVKVRDAEIQEVFSDLSIKGDLSLADFDPNRIALATQGPSQSKASDRGKLFEIGPCKGKFGKDETDQLMGCSFDFADAGGIRLKGTAGAKNIAFKGVNLSLAKPSESTLGDTSFSPYFSIDAEVPSSDGSAQSFKVERTIGRIQAALPQTFGFVQVQVPLGASLKLPFFRLGIGLEGSLSYSAGGGLKDPNFSFKTPAATLATDKPFKASIDDAFVGMKSGVELVLVRIPLPAVQVFAIGADDGRVAGTGAFVKAGARGTLSVEVRTLHAPPCFKYDLKPAAGFQIQNTGGGGYSQLDAVDAPFLHLQAYKGESGCDDPIGAPTIGLEGEKTCDTGSGISGGYPYQVTQCSYASAKVVVKCPAGCWDVTKPGLYPRLYELVEETLEMTGTGCNAPYHAFTRFAARTYFTHSGNGNIEGGWYTLTAKNWTTENPTTCKVGGFDYVQGLTVRRTSDQKLFQLAYTIHVTAP